MKIKDLLNQINEDVITFPSSAVLADRAKQSIDKNISSIFSNSKNIMTEDTFDKAIEHITQGVITEITKTGKFKDRQTAQTAMANLNNEFRKKFGSNVFDYILNSASQKLQTNAPKAESITEAPKYIKKGNNGYGPVLSKNRTQKATPKKRFSHFGALASMLVGLSSYGAGHYSGQDHTSTTPTAQVQQAPNSEIGKEVRLYHDNEIDPAAIKKPVQADAKKQFYKIGAPYHMNGVKYHPHYDPHYKKVGIASWYGAETKGQYTANHDVFDYNEIAAAHPTLPIPCKVWVTNLENGKKILVTVNDRGPYAKGRVIDLTKAAAEKLGYADVGTAKVKIVYDKKETEKYLKDKGLYDQYHKLTMASNK